MKLRYEVLRKRQDEKKGEKRTTYHPQSGSPVETIHARPLFAREISTIRR